MPPPSALKGGNWSPPMMRQEGDYKQSHSSGGLSQVPSSAVGKEQPARHKCLKRAE